jgi:hypothetical protein
MTDFELTIGNLSPMTVQAKSPRSAVAKCLDDPESVALIDHGHGEYAMFRVSSTFLGVLTGYVGKIRRLDE